MDFSYIGVTYSHLILSFFDYLGNLHCITISIKFQLDLVRTCNSVVRASGGLLGYEHLFEVVLHEYLLFSHTFLLGGNFGTDFVSPFLVSLILLALLVPDIDKLVWIMHILVICQILAQSRSSLVNLLVAFKVLNVIDVLHIAKLSFFAVLGWRALLLIWGCSNLMYLINFTGLFFLMILGEDVHLVGTLWRPNFDGKVLLPAKDFVNSWIVRHVLKLKALYLGAIKKGMWYGNFVLVHLIKL